MPAGKSKSPYRTCKKVQNLRESVAKDTLESKNYQKIYKCYIISLQYEERPVIFSNNIESVPKKLNKLPIQEFPHTEVEDLADKSNIFRDFRSSKISSVDSLEISNVVSNVVAEQFMRAETHISDI